MSRSLAIVSFALVVVAAGVAQNSSASFDDLARRASDAQDARPAEAVALYRQALGLRPDWSEGWLNLGASLFQLGRFAEARDALRKGVRLAPGKGTPLAFLGMAEYELGDYRQALSDILQGESIGLADTPEFVAAVRYRAALMALRFSDFVLALDQLRPLVRAGNNSDPILDALGVCALAMPVVPAEVPAAKRPLVRAAGRAAWTFVAERAGESAPLFHDLAAQFPDEPGVHYMYGVFLIGRDPTAAEQEFRRELRISPEHALARVQLALLLIRNGDAAAAVRIAEEAAKLQASSALCQATLGRALLNADQTTRAIAVLQKAAKLAPDAAPPHFYLEQAYRRAGRVAEARREKAEWTRLRAQQEPAELPSDPAR